MNLEARAFVRRNDGAFGEDPPFVTFLEDTETPGEIKLCFAAPDHSNNPDEPMGRIVVAAWERFRQANQNHDALMAVREGDPRCINPCAPWQRALQEGYDSALLTWLATQETLSGRAVELVPSEPEGGATVDALIAPESEGGFGHEPKYVALYHALVIARGFLDRRAQGTLPVGVASFKDHIRYHTYHGKVADGKWQQHIVADKRFGDYATLDRLEATWDELFAPVPFDPSASWPTGNGPLELGCERIGTHYMTLLHGIKTGNDEVDTKLLLDGPLRQVDSDSLYFRDLHLFDTLLHLLRAEAPVFCVQGSLHWMAQFEALLEAFPPPRYKWTYLIGSTACEYALAGPPKSL